MTLFFHPAGPCVQYRDGVLYIKDLNPEVNIRWRMSRMEMLAFGWRCIVASVRRA